MERGLKVLVCCLLVIGSMVVLSPVVFSEDGTTAPVVEEANEAPVVAVEEPAMGEMEESSAEELAGEVVSVDTTASTIVVKTTNEETQASEETILNVNDIVKAEIDGTVVPAADLKAGDKVSLWYAAKAEVEMPTDSTDMEK